MTYPPSWLAPLARYPAFLRARQDGPRLPDLVALGATTWALSRAAALALPASHDAGVEATAAPADWMLAASPPAPVARWELGYLFGSPGYRFISAPDFDFDAELVGLVEAIFGTTDAPLVWHFTRTPGMVCARAAGRVVAFVMARVRS